MEIGDKVKLVRMVGVLRSDSDKKRNLAKNLTGEITEVVHYDLTHEKYEQLSNRAEIISVRKLRTHPGRVEGLTAAIPRHILLGCATQTDRAKSHAMRSGCGIS